MKPLIRATLQECRRTRFENISSENNEGENEMERVVRVIEKIIYSDSDYKVSIKRKAKGLSPVKETMIETNSEVRREVMKNLNSSHAIQLVSHRNVKVGSLPKKCIRRSCKPQ